MQKHAQWNPQGILGSANALNYDSPGMCFGLLSASRRNSPNMID